MGVTGWTAVGTRPLVVVVGWRGRIRGNGHFGFSQCKPLAPFLVWGKNSRFPPNISCLSGRSQIQLNETRWGRERPFSRPQSRGTTMLNERDQANLQRHIKEAEDRATAAGMN